jgi:hypothetical protein
MEEAFLFIKKERIGQINLAEELVFLTQPLVRLTYSQAVVASTGGETLSSFFFKRD